MLYGGQDYDGDFHFNMFTPASMGDYLREAGFVNLQVLASGRRNGNCYEFEIAPNGRRRRGGKQHEAASPSFSIVINTLNRGAELQKTLDSLRWLKYSGQFEVVVVNGPSTDHSDDVIAAWSPGARR